MSSFASHDTTVSREWMKRPDDQRFTSLEGLSLALHDRKNNMVTHTNMDPRSLSVVLNEGGDDLRLLAPGIDGAELTSWSFGQLAQRAKAPAAYLRGLPVELAAECLNHGLVTGDGDIVAPYIYEGAYTKQLRAATSPTYGRIYDADVVKAVMHLNARDGGRWKVPGVLNWGALQHNPHVDVTKENTTLYASDRDVFLFLVDDLHPVQVGTLPNGQPDMMFRGFYVSNSEVGSASFTLATMYMRAVCQNRILWGVEGKQELTFRHTSGAPDRFLREVGNRLSSFAEMSSTALVDGVNKAKENVLPTDRPEQIRWVIRETGITQARAAAVLNAVELEEGHPATSVWDVAQGLTAVARRIPRQDERIQLERTAKTLLDAVTK